MTIPAVLDAPKLFPEERLGRKPREALEFYSAAAAVFLAPINYLRLDVAYITLSDALFVLSAALMVLNGRLPLRPFGNATSLWFGSLLLLVGGLMLSSIMVGDPSAGALVVGQYVFAFALVPLVILGRRAQELISLIGVFVVSMIIVALHGAYYVHFHEGPSPFIAGNGRLRSLVERTNETAALFAFAIVFGLWLFLTKRLSTSLAVSSALVLGYGLILTGSNTGLFLTCAGILSLSILSGSVRFASSIFVLGAAGIAATILWGDLFLPEVFVERVLVALQAGDILQAGTFAGRLLLMQEAVRMANDTVVFGLGADQYRHVSAYSAPVHNVYLLILVEGGLISLAGLVGLLLSLVYLGWSALIYRPTRWGGAITITIAAMFSACLTGIPHCYARFWVVPIVLAAAASLLPKRTTSLTLPMLQA